MNLIIMAKFNLHNMNAQLEIHALFHLAIWSNNILIQSILTKTKSKTAMRLLFFNIKIPVLPETWTDVANPQIQELGDLALVLQKFELQLYYVIMSNKVGYYHWWISA